MVSAGSTCPSRSRRGQMGLEGAPLLEAVPFELGPSLHVGPEPPNAALASLPPGHAWHAASHRRGSQSMTAGAACVRPDLPQDIGADRQPRNCLARAPARTVREGGTEKGGRLPRPAWLRQVNKGPHTVRMGPQEQGRPEGGAPHPTPLRRSTVLATKTPNR